jgi:predicted nuclease of predicted toxin-antitoxin system
LRGCAASRCSKLAADENFNSDIVRGVVRLLPELDFVRIQDVGLRGVDDKAVLAWAASESRILFTHDASTMIGFAHDRVVRGEPMAGIFAVRSTVPVREIIEEIVLIASASKPDEWVNQVWYLPLR